MRWDEQKVENDLRLPGVGDGTQVRTFDAPEAMGINFHEVRARSALNHVPGGRFGFSWTVNPYRGCTHACLFCYARRTHTYLGLDAGRDFEREIVVKVNVPELLRHELRRPKRPDLLPRYEALYQDRAYMRPEARKRTTRALKPWGMNRRARNDPARTGRSKPDDVAVGDSGGGSENGRPAPARRTLPPRQAPPPQRSLF